LPVCFSLLPLLACFKRCVVFASTYDVIYVVTDYVMSLFEALYIKRSLRPYVKKIEDMNLTTVASHLYYTSGTDSPSDRKIKSTHKESILITMLSTGQVYRPRNTSYMTIFN
jgi:hypothetical protein